MIFSRHASATATAVVASSALFASTLLVVTAASTPVAKYSSPAAASSTNNNGEENVAAVVDAGILALSSSNSRGDIIFGADRELQGLCSVGFVECNDGLLADGITSCVDACKDGSGGYNCCNGDGSCYKFTGKVCKDGSCEGDSACKQASIPYVVESCKGAQACKKVGYVAVGVTANKVGNFINSCTATKSCYLLAYNEGGGAGSLENSCTYGYSCTKLGEGDQGPVTSDVKDCCTTFKACYNYNESNVPPECKVTQSTPEPSSAPTSAPSSAPTRGPKAGKNKKAAKTKKPTFAPTYTPAPTDSAAPTNAKSAKKEKTKTANLFE